MKEKIFPYNQKLIVCLMLAVVGGFLDAYTYTLKGGVFANAQTGNFVLLGINIIEKRDVSIIYYLISIATFAFGILTAEFIKRRDNKIQWINWHHIILIIETIILFIIGFIKSVEFDLMVCVLITYVCAIQVSTFRKLEGLAFASTMCTGNMRFGCERFVEYRMNKDKKSLTDAFKYFFVIVFFCIGAGMGAKMCYVYKEKSIWFCCIILFIVWGYLMINENTKNQEISL